MDAADPTPPGSDGEVQSDRVADGVEHLQTAARELVAAARSFLDVVEKVVEDDQRMSGAAASFADLLGRGLGAAASSDLGGLLGARNEREPAWLRNDPDHPDAAGDVFGRNDGPGDERADVDDVDDEPVDRSAPKDSGPRNAPPRTPAAKRPASSDGSDGARRVRRIAVD